MVGVNGKGQQIWMCKAKHTFAVFPQSQGEQQPDEYLPVPRARNTDPETSRDAADSMVQAAEGQRNAILAELRKSGPLTADEIDVHLFSGHHTSARRLPELAELGLVHRSTDKRPTRAGRAAFIWRATS